VSLGGSPVWVDYEPAESRTGMFGGNSNWRGPVWMPVNYLVVRSLQRYARSLGAETQVEYPTGSGNVVGIAGSRSAGEYAGLCPRLPCASGWWPTVSVATRRAPSPFCRPVATTGCSWHRPRPRDRHGCWACQHWTSSWSSATGGSGWPPMSGPMGSSTPRVRAHRPVRPRRRLAEVALRPGRRPDRGRAGHGLRSQCGRRRASRHGG